MVPAHDCRFRQRRGEDLMSVAPEFGASGFQLAATSKVKMACLNRSGRTRKPVLDLEDIQGDVLEGLQKEVENFIFFKIMNTTSFKRSVSQNIVNRITSARRVHDQGQIIENRGRRGQGGYESFHGLNVGFTKDGLIQLIGAIQLEPAFQRGADHQDTIKNLNDPSRSSWLKDFISDRIDGIFLVTGPNLSSVTFHSSELVRLLGSTIKVVYSEIGATRPGAERRREHFGFVDGISQPGICGLTPISDPRRRPHEGLPGQDLIWPGEFVFGYPGQHPEDPHKEGPAPEMAAPWMRNGSYMVFRRLEQKVPEFRRFVREQAARLGMDPELLASRMVGRWKSGAPLELAPRLDDARLGRDPDRNNDFDYGDDPIQSKCPFAAHIRKVYPRDDAPGGEAEAQRHRIIRAGIAFGPEVAPGEATTRHSRGLMFVCYQASIERQFEFIQQRYANNPAFVGEKRRPGGGAPVTPGYDPIIGQAPNGGPRAMDEPFPNYPARARRTALEMPNQFVELTAAAYFFMPSITALHTVLT
jgi:Dyp-type peroxidase family